MGMPRGLRKLTAVANTLQAREDWDKLACEAVDLGLEEYEIVEPNPQDGHRKIDECIAQLRIKIQSKKERLAWHAGREERARARTEQ